MKWRRHYVAHSPDYLETLPATFHATNYVARTLALDYRMFGDEGVAEALVDIAEWQIDFMKRGYTERGLRYGYLAAAHAWWITREDRYLQWTWHAYSDQVRSETAEARGPDDSGFLVQRSLAFFEVGQLPFFLRACHEAGFSAANPPPRPEGLARGE